MSLLHRPASKGVHFKNYKRGCQNMPARVAALPVKAVVAMAQSSGPEAKPVVSVGQRVENGQLVGEAQGPFSANVHAPNPGHVTGIYSIDLPAGRRCAAVEIETGGAFKMAGERAPRDYKLLLKSDILHSLAKAGAVGMGGAGFPVHAKYDIKGRPVDFLLANGCECEPYACADYRLMLEKSREIAEGIAIAALVLEAKEVLVCVEESGAAAGRAVLEALQPLEVSARLKVLENKYPQGSEKTLVYETTGRIVASDRLPIDARCIVSNVASLYSVYQAVALDQPIVSRYVTIAGGAVAFPQTLEAKIGTPLDFLFEECGGFKNRPARIIAGGPMMGGAAMDLQTPLTKTVGLILALSEKEAQKISQTACIGCGACLKACPMSLAPALLYKLFIAGQEAAVAKMGLADCVECGACSYVCPAKLPLSQAFGPAKKKLKAFEKKEDNAWQKK